MPTRAIALRSLSVALCGALLAAACLRWSELQNGACGDGFVGREEACDDGNRISGDACNDSCRVEPPYCGDGRMDAGEACDDANALDSDDCIAGCRAASCGDGKLWDVQEVCDDANVTAGDGCSPTCQVEPLPSGPRCGDGTLDTDEVCDDGNQSNADACANGCAWATCGDGLVREGVEECDDGNPEKSDGCSRGCMRCGSEPGSYFRLGNGHCYTLHVDGASQGQARTTCQAEGGDLWTSTSQGEGRDVSANLELSERYWLGLTTNANGRAWVSGEDTTYSNFAPGEPSAPTGKCVALQHGDITNSWLSEECSDHLPFVCERTPVLIFPINHHAFKLHTGALPADEARQRCQADGGYLAILETADERLFVGKNIDLAAWVDATDSVTEGQFLWANGQAVDATAFAMDQPDDANATQGCLYVNAGERLADGPCAENHPYLCEID